MKRLITKHALIISIYVLSIAVAPASGGIQFDIAGPPAGFSNFGNQVFLLSNGNFVVADREFEPTGLTGGSETGFGAVYLYNGKNGQLISTLTGSQTGDQVGNRIEVLPNGNFVVQSTRWINGGISQAGAVTLCNGITGCNGTVSPTNSLVGSQMDDGVGSDIRVLPNSNYVVLSGRWDNGNQTDAGAVTFCNGVTGCTGIVSSSNSLVGSSTDDSQERFVVILSNGDYVVKSPLWDSTTFSNAGAVTWCSGTTGCVGEITSANSLTGSSNDDVIGVEINPLQGGKYAVISTSFTPVPSVSKLGGLPQNVGAVTICNSPGGCVGLIDETNSLVGSSNNDFVGNNGAYELSNGKIVVLSSNWSNAENSVGGIISGVGAATICNDAASCVGQVTTANSLHGTGEFDGVGSRMLVLPNGNYVVQSIAWRNGLGLSGPRIGAATFCNGTTGCTGPVTLANSLHGSNSEDRVGFDGFVLPNGNYVILNEDWEPDGFSQVGAVTFCNGTTGCTGEVSASNSLIGINNGDMLGNFGHKVLANGNFVIANWFTGTDDFGSVTFCSGTTGCPLGQISPSNSLVGQSSQDQIGSGGEILALDNGNYVVLSPLWNGPTTSNIGPNPGADVGAVTLCNGNTGCTGTINPTNSLVGTTPGDRIGSNGDSLGQNYAVGSPNWDNGADADVGVARFCPGTGGCVGELNSSNSLVGATAGDRFGSGNNGIKALPNGDYVVVSDPSGDLKLGGGGPGGITAVTYGVGSTQTVGAINNDNSVFAIAPNSRIEQVYDPVNDQLIVARAGDDLVTIFRNTRPQLPLFDFDGDGRTDISIFRPSEGNWYINQSTDGFAVFNWGLAGDKLTPADFDGDGKTDIAVWREIVSNVSVFYILNSSDFTIRTEVFGVSGDDAIVVGDWDGDGKADPAVYRDSAFAAQSRFYYLGSDNNPGNNITYLNWGNTNDKPVRGDFDGDGKLDLAVFRPANQYWYIKNSSDDTVQYAKFGLASDRRISGDFDGDGKTDLAVFRPSDNTWYYQKSTTQEVTQVQFGLSTDQITPGDYDGDGKTDLAVYRPGNQIWYINQSASNSLTYQTFGLANDIAVPGSFIGN